MPTHYQVLGITNASSEQEIKRAYRILARRYHPDVNPEGNTAEAFQRIAEAYATLSDKEKRKNYDLHLRNTQVAFQKSFEKAHKRYLRNKSESSNATKTRHQKIQKNKLALHHKTKLASAIKTSSRLIQRARRLISGSKSSSSSRAISVIELSLSVNDSLWGAKKAVDLSFHEDKPRKISVTIPPGVRSGSIIRFRNPNNHLEEIVIIVALESHPWLSISERGLLLEVPISLSEALYGAKIEVPTLIHPVRITLQPGTQSGTEVRLKNQGIINRNGERGDLYVRFWINLPSQSETSAMDPSIDSLLEDYGQTLREHLILPEDTSK